MSVDELKEGLLVSCERKDNIVQIKAFDCPRLLRRDLVELFPDRDLKACNLTIITYAMKTENDMGVWKEEMDEERAEMTEKFIESACRICERLQKQGFWADFIEPASGRPYFGHYTNATLFESNDHFKNLGFSIKDVGCCKVIVHSEWGRMVFVGTIITNAKIGSPAVKMLTNGTGISE